MLALHSLIRFMASRLPHAQRAVMLTSGVAGFSEDAASLYLKPGDVIEAEIERIGILRNPVISWQDAHGQPAPPRVRW